MNAEDQPPTKGHAAARSVAAAATATIIGALPAFLVGGVALLIRTDLAIGETELGAAISVGFLVAAVGSAPAGLLVERIGGFLGMRVAVALSALSLVGLGVLTANWWHLTGFLALAGMAMALGSPASNEVVARTVAPSRQGAAFGLKTCAAPAATLVAGALLPLVAVSYGWQWAFRLVAAVSLVLLASMPRARCFARKKESRTTSARPAVMGRLGFLTMSTVFGNAAATGMVGFYVESAALNGIDPKLAGTLLTLGAATGIGARVLWGWVADRCAAVDWLHVGALFAVGALGVIGVAQAQSPVDLAVFTVVVFGSGWAWPGVFMTRLMRDFPAAPGAASGVIAVGVFSGGVVGPVVVGALVEHFSMVAGWAAVGISMALAALCLACAALTPHPLREQPSMPVTG